MILQPLAEISTSAIRSHMKKQKIKLVNEFKQTFQLSQIFNGENGKQKP